MNIRRRYKAKRRRKEAKTMADLHNKMRGRGPTTYGWIAKPDNAPAS